MKTTETADKKGKESSYPYYDLPTCIEFASHIKTYGGAKSGVKKSQLAHQVGLAESTPSFFQRLSSCKTFGIIDGWGEYSLTDLGRMLFYPQNDIDAQDAKFAMFSTPVAFAFIIKRFDGERLPPTNIMGNIFHQELGIPDSWKDRVAQIFARSANYLEIIDAGGCLRYDAAMHTRIRSSTELASEPAESPKKPLNPLDVPCDLTAVDDAPEGLNAWSYSHKGQKIKVQTPEILTKELWEKLNAYVQILKPGEISGQQ